ncbi:MAG: hypothetical protein ACRBBW_19570 [Cellvibrionaceae bacterium]
MRSIFLSLVVVNVALFAFYWFQQGESVEVAVVESASSHGAELLVLLEELESEALAEMFAAKERIQFSPDDVVFGGEGDIGVEEVVAPSLAEPVVPEQPMCTYVGPFKALLPAEYFVEHLSALEVLAEVQRVEVPGTPSFWVHQQPQSSRKEALRRLHELQAKNIDSYVIPKGDLENGISFGLYNKLESAERRLERIQAKGYQAEIRRVDRTFEEVWVSLAVAEAEKVGQELWFELMNREDGLEKRQNFCPDVASE